MQVTQPQAYEGQPAQPRTVSPYDGLTVYGPLGIGWLITLMILAVVWKDHRSQRREFLAQLDALAKAHALAIEHEKQQCKGERDEFRKTLTSIAEECATASVKNGEMWRDHGRELRTTMESLTVKIGSRG